MRIFGSDKLDSMLQRLGLKENEAIVHSWINKALEKAQQKVESRNFDIRKNLLKFDNVSNDQRKVIFDQRIEWMKMDSVAEIVTDMRHVAIDDLVAKHVPENAYPEQWDVAGLKTELERVLGLDLPVDEWAKEEGIADEELIARIDRRADEHMASKVAQWGAETMRAVEKTVLLQTLDHLWREHLVMLEHLRQVIGLRGYGQRDPLNEYKAEAYNLFEAMSQNLREQVTGYLMRIQVMDTPPEQSPDLPYMEAHHLNPDNGMDYGMASRRWRRRWPATATPCAPSTATPPIRTAGARSAATRSARAAPARSTSTATGGLLKQWHFVGGLAKRNPPSFCYACGMPNYRRAFVPGGCWFFTVNLLDRRRSASHRRYRGTAGCHSKDARQRYAFHIDAIVVLPEHLHAVWTLPPGDADFSTRWRNGWRHAEPRDRRG